MAEKFNKQQTRAAFARQPARVLLVDYRPPFDADIAEYLHRGLTEFFSLVTNLQGPIRAPFFGLFGLGSCTENLFPLQHVKGNFSRLYSALEELKFFAQDLPATSDTDVLAQGLQDAVDQFKRQSQSFRQVSTSCCQLELIILTCTSSTAVSKRIEQFTRHLDLDTLKKIQVAAVQNQNQGSATDGPGTENSESPSTSPGDRPVACGVVEVVFLERDVLSFQSFFKSWLNDCATDQEHLRIALPSVLNTLDDEGRERNSLTIKCDIHERLLNPALLPHRDRFTINSELGSKAATASKQGAASMPVYHLVAVQLLKSEALCESVLYGMPHIVFPTQCWKLDWEELESNEQHFHALCIHLKMRDLVLLAKMAPESSAQRALPCGHFVLLPSDSRSLLLKSVAVNELMLMAIHQAPSEKAGDAAMQLVDSCLDQLEIAAEFNPLLVSSGLYTSLTAHVHKQGPSARALKRRFQPPQAKQHQQQKRGAGHQSPARKATARPVVRPVIFTAPKPMPPSQEHRPRGGKTQRASSSKRLRISSASDRYNSSTPSFPEDL